MEELEQEVAAMGVSPSSPPRRSGRKRIYNEPPATPPAKWAKRKSTPKPLTQNQLKKFYMNKSSARFARHALETIYEDPVRSKNGEPVFIGTPKIKRSINMERDLSAATKQKKNCRKKKVKRLGLGGRCKKLSDEDFQKRLGLIDAFINAESDEALASSSLHVAIKKAVPDVKVEDCAALPMDISDEL